MRINGVTIRRTYVEVPTMDDRKWDKIPGMPADVFMADIEDSVPPELKERARDKVVGLVKDPSYFEGREFVCRPNNLDTAWGRDDLDALAEANASFVLYPKVRSADEVRQVLEIFDSYNATPELHLIIETPQAVIRLEDIAAVPGVAGLLLGPGDLSLESGIALLDGAGVFGDGFVYARSKTVMAARAFGLEATEGLFVANLKDTEAVREGTRRSRMFGFSGNLTFYPPQIPTINEVRTPDPEATAWSKRVIAAFEEARASGQGAASVDGKWVTVHQFKEAKKALEIASALGLD